MFLCRPKEGKNEMKRSIGLTVAFSVTVILLLLASSDSTTKAQQRRLFRWDTGVVKLGPNQALRLFGDSNADGVVDAADYVVFKATKYGEGACNGSVCKLIVLSSTQTNRQRLVTGEAISMELLATTYGRGIVTSNRRDLRVTAAIIDTTTGGTVSHIIMANTEGDFH
jgi:hypothetical protein